MPLIADIKVYDASGLSSGSGGVKAASGTTTISAGATVILTSVTKTAGQIFFPAGFIVNGVSGTQLVFSSIAASGSDSLCLFCRATGTSNQVSLIALNNNQSSDRVLDWALMQS